MQLSSCSEGGTACIVQVVECRDDGDNGRKFSWRAGIVVAEVPLIVVAELNRQLRAEVRQLGGAEVYKPGSDDSALKKNLTEGEMVSIVTLHSSTDAASLAVCSVAGLSSDGVGRWSAGRGRSILGSWRS